MFSSDKNSQSRVTSNKHRLAAFVLHLSMSSGNHSVPCRSRSSYSTLSLGRRRVLSSLSLMLSGRPVYVGPGEKSPLCESRMSASRRERGIWSDRSPLPRFLGLGPPTGAIGPSFGLRQMGYIFFYLERFVFVIFLSFGSGCF